MPVIVTEHGMQTDDDTERAAFIEPSLRGLRAAMADGVPVLGYHHWTLMDNFEWIFGYEGKLGLHSVDRDDVRAHPQAQRRRLRRAGEGAAAWMSCRRSASSTTGRRSASARPRRGCRGRSRASRAGGRPPTSWRSATRSSGWNPPRRCSCRGLTRRCRPREARTVRVRVTGADGSVSDWSDPATVERGLDAGSWQAALISPASPSVVLRRCCAASSRSTGTSPSRGCTRPRTAIYVAEINGRRVGDDALAPGWTSYHRRLRYQAYDVTGLLRPGANAIGFQVADGWWRGRLGFVPGARDTYGTFARTARAARGHPRRWQPDVIGTDARLALRDGARSGPVRGPVRRRALRRHP